MPHDPSPKPSADRCDSEALAALVTGALPPAAERRLETHLDRCPECRERLDEVAASDADWTSVREVLSDDDDEIPSGPFDPDRDADDGALATGLLRTIQPCLAPTDDDSMLGRLGPYEIAGIVGSGGMGIVLKGHDRALDRFVAIKVLKPHLATSGAARKRFLREARAAAGIVHDAVIAIHGVGEADGLPYLVMPYCRGTTLAKRLRDRGPLDLREILRIGLQTARGLAAAHAQGLVHRDVKPANILLEDGVDRVLLTDFGLARAADDASLTVTGLLAGTPHFMSPEQALGKPIDARSDLFSLGAVLFTLATGKPPFRAESSHAVLRMVTDVEPADVRLANPDMPAWLAGIVGRLLAKDPAARFQSATEVAGMLEACLAHVNDPLAIPLPPEVVGAAPAKPSPVAPAPDHQAAPRTFLASLRRIMSDQRLLSIAALVIFLMALLLPWPILALGRAEPAIIYAVIAALTSLLFAWLGRRDSLGRLVLKLAGTAAILGGAVVAFWVLSDSVLSGERLNAERVAALHAQNLAKQAQMEAIVRTRDAMQPMSIPVPTAPRVASGPDPMPVVGWPGHNAPAEMPVLTATVPSSTPAPAAMGSADLMTPGGVSLSLAGPFGTMKTELANSLERLERWLAEHPHEAVAEVTIRGPGALPDHQTKTLGPHADLVLLNLEDATTWQQELTTGFLGRSLTEVIRGGGIPAPPTNAATEIGVQTRLEDGDGFQQEIYVSGEPATGAVTTKERRVRFTLDGTFRTLNRTVCTDFREAAPGIRLPHWIEIVSYDIDSNQPENVIPRKSVSVTVVVEEWRPVEGEAPAEANGDAQAAEADPPITPPTDVVPAASAADTPQWHVEIDNGSAVVRATKKTDSEFVEAMIVALKEAGIDQIAMRELETDAETAVTDQSLSVRIVDDIAEITASIDLPSKVVESTIRNLLHPATRVKSVKLRSP
ncbi:MAG: serine/threonine protein kinase [Planctomycetaceae bacterium]|nr:serine/threonine protein kinase [Planctomycetaceae bacterium]